MNLKEFIEQIWKRSTHKEPLGIIQNVVYLFLCLLEPIYKIGFFFAQKYAQLQPRYTSLVKVISVGNISAGGTGKSVLTSFLVTHLLPKKGAILVRGYGGAHEKKDKSLYINQENCQKYGPFVTGDEAYMFANTLDVPVFVGKDRVASCKLLEAFITSKKLAADYLVLDDAYQNQRIHKDVEILLLDARHPFENGHCFPAGRLRERAINRADLIILTHANQVSRAGLDALAHDLSALVAKDRIFLGKHEFKGFYYHGKGLTEPCFFVGKKIGIIAGIGSFSGFIKTVEQTGVKIAEMFQFPDHHSYSYKDCEYLVTQLQMGFVDAFIMTRKDWYKIAERLHNELSFARLPVYVLDVEFDFLSSDQKKAFLDMVNRFLEKR